MKQALLFKKKYMPNLLMHKIGKVSFLLAFVLMMMGGSVMGQVNYVSGTYSQNFDGLASTTNTSNVWTNNTTISGWYLYNSANTAITTYGSETGSTGNSTFNSYGLTSGATERALGSQGSGGTYWGSPSSGSIAGWMAVQITNGSGGTLNSISIGFDGEQWRKENNASPHTMVLEYGFGSTFTNVTTWIAPGGNFDWTSPVTGATTAASVNGNVAGLVSSRGGTVSGLTWTASQTLWIRWVERNDAGNDHGLAIDNFTFTASSSNFTVSFNSNGGTGTMSNQSASSSTALTSNSFIRTGYTFAGWATTQNGTVAYADGASYPFTASTTLYAQWTANNLVVTYDAQGGSTVSNGATTTGGVISTAPVAPTRAGYTFNGWYVATSGGAAISFPYTHNQTANFTLYAQWTANNYTVTFDANGGTGNMANQTSNTAAAINANTFTKTCSSFTGWNTAANGSGTAYADGASYSFTANTTLYAQWSAQNQWTGTATNFWNNASNWSCGHTPTATENLLIPSGTPLLDLDYEVPAGYTLTINGTGSLTINPGQKLTLTGAADFGGKLVTVASNASGSGAIVLNGGALTGASNVGLQQWFSAQRAWRMLSNPFTTAITAAAISANNTSLSVNQSGTGDMVVYNSANDSWSANNSISANSCYGFFYKGLQSDFNGTPGLNNYSGSGPTATTFTVKGTLNTGSVSVTPNASATYTLVGNPYAAPVNSIALTGGSAAPYYYYQASSASTDIKVKSGAWIAAASNSSNTTPIPMMGVIAYQAASNATFSINTSDINTTNTSLSNLYKTTSSSNQIVLELHRNNSLFDRLIVREEASAGLNTVDANDLVKMNNVVANIYAITPNKDHLAVYAEPSFTQAIPLGISAPNGAYQFKITGAMGASDWYLIDNYLHQQIVLNTQTTYSFDINNDATSKGENRFELLKKMWTTQIGSITSMPKLSLLSNVVHHEIRFAQNSVIDYVNYKLVDTHGAVVKEGVLRDVHQVIDVNDLVPAMYVLQLVNAKNLEVFKIVKQ